MALVYVLELGADVAKLERGRGRATRTLRLEVRDRWCCCMRCHRRAQASCPRSSSRFESIVGAAVATLVGGADAVTTSHLAFENRTQTRCERWT